MPVRAAVPASLPPVALAAFEGPLDLLLHLIREHRVDIADIPIVEITDHYLAYLRAMEAMNLSVAGEFLVMAATLLEIKSRMLLPKPPRENLPEDEQGDDPRRELAERLLEYQRYQAFVETLGAWEDDRRHLFFRGQADYGGLYELPIAFGQLSPQSLIRALTRMLAESGTGEDDVTSVRRRKITLRLAMASLWRRIQSSGSDGLLFEDCFARPYVRLEIVLTFLALLELLRQGQVKAEQSTTLAEIWVRAIPLEERNPHPAADGDPLPSEERAKEGEGLGMRAVDA
ncbi:MAG: segregation/condensation protein A [Armatimonadota bacterium]|nr:segregation/condensation protein A [Armatimonadota bacterium]